MTIGYYAEETTHDGPRRRLRHEAARVQSMEGDARRVLASRAAVLGDRADPSFMPGFACLDLSALIRKDDCIGNSEEYT